MQGLSIKKFSGRVSVTVTVAVMLPLFPYNVAVAFLLRYGSDPITLRLRFQNLNISSFFFD